MGPGNPGSALLGPSPFAAHSGSKDRPGAISMPVQPIPCCSRLFLRPQSCQAKGPASLVISLQPTEVSASKIFLFPQVQVMFRNYFSPTSSSHRIQFCSSTKKETETQRRKIAG